MKNLAKQSITINTESFQWDENGSKINENCKEMVNINSKRIAVCCSRQRSVTGRRRSLRWSANTHKKPPPPSDAVKIKTIKSWPVDKIKSWKENIFLWQLENQVGDRKYRAMQWGKIIPSTFYQQRVFTLGVILLINKKGLHYFNYSCTHLLYTNSEAYF